jgi:hypothetical protein
MSRVRVIKDGRVIGTLPSHNGEGYSGASMAVYSIAAAGKMLSLDYTCYWLDAADAPTGPCMYGVAGPAFRMEMFLDASPFTVADLAEIEGWDPAMRPPDAFATLKEYVRGR